MLDICAKAFPTLAAVKRSVTLITDNGQGCQRLQELGIRFRDGVGSELYDAHIRRGMLVWINVILEFRMTLELASVELISQTTAKEFLSKVVVKPDYRELLPPPPFLIEEETGVASLANSQYWTAFGLLQDFVGILRPSKLDRIIRTHGSPKKKTASRPRRFAESASNAASLLAIRSRRIDNIFLQSMGARSFGLLILHQNCAVPSIGYRLWRSSSTQDRNMIPEFTAARNRSKSHQCRTLIKMEGNPTQLPGYPGITTRLRQN